MLAILLASALGPQARSLNVYAAASLKEPFTALAKRYEATHPGLKITLSFAGSQSLASQINQGAPADVFAGASAKNLKQIAFVKDSYRVFIRNKLQVALRRGLTGIRSFADLSRVRRLVVADPAVPVGHYTEAVFSSAAAAYGTPWLNAVRSHIVSREADVKAVLVKVRLGEADAGIVYVSDVISVDNVAPLPIPSRFNQIAEYPVAIPVRAKNRDDAKHFIKFLLDYYAQRAFESDGFLSFNTYVHALVLTGVKGTPSLPVPLPPRFAQATVQALNEKNQRQKFTGTLVSALPGFAKASQITFIGADHYAQTLKTAELKARKAILVLDLSSNYQLIVPGMKPSIWVNWIRRIEMR